MGKSKNKSSFFSLFKKIFGRSLGAIILLFFFYFLLLLWPIREIFTPSTLFHNNLIILTNENEARPCGGFATAYGTFKVFPPHLELYDIYHLGDHSFGPADFPLQKVANELYFWDLGTSPDPEKCAASFLEKYNLIASEKAKQVFLADFKTLEKIIDLFAPFSFSGETLGKGEFFAKMSRHVADTDRHDEESLKNRKSLMKELFPLLAKKSITHPLKTLHASQILGQALQNQSLFLGNVSPSSAPDKNSFGVLEWNLGGGKSSRYLEKEILLHLKEKSPDRWTLEMTFRADHRSLSDEPLSQDWKGGFEILFPDFLEKKSHFIETTVPMNGSFEKKWIFEHSGKMPPFNVFVPRSQKVLLHFSIRLFPQKSFQNASFDTWENFGNFYAPLNKKTLFSWEEKRDTLPPFIVFHKVIDAEVIASSLLPDSQKEKLLEGNFWAEIHFNEEVRLGEDFGIFIEDKDQEIQEISQAPEIKDYVLKEDQKTLLISFVQKVPQKGERFFIWFEGVFDAFENPIQEKKRTIIDRRDF